jgi:hypothetical protein
MAATTPNAEENLANRAFEAVRLTMVKTFLYVQALLEFLDEQHNDYNLLHCQYQQIMEDQFTLCPMTQCDTDACLSRLAGSVAIRSETFHARFQNFSATVNELQQTYIKPLYYFTDDTFNVVDLHLTTHEQIWMDYFLETINVVLDYYTMQTDERDNWKDALSTRCLVHDMHRLAGLDYCPIDHAQMTEESGWEDICRLTADIFPGWQQCYWTMHLQRVYGTPLQFTWYYEYLQIVQVHLLGDDFLRRGLEDEVSLASSVDNEAQEYTPQREIFLRDYLLQRLVDRNAGSYCGNRIQLSIYPHPNPADAHARRGVFSYGDMDPVQMNPYFGQSCGWVPPVAAPAEEAASPAED